jgi:hypothetical protein
MEAEVGVLPVVNFWISIVTTFKGLFWQITKGRIRFNFRYWVDWFFPFYLRKLEQF